MILILIAYVELSIGLITLFGLATYEFFHLSTKSPAVAAFVIVSNLISASLGIGLLNYRRWARALLLFFSGYVILTKLFLFLGLIKLNGEIVLFIPTGLKNTISIFYHVFIIIFLNLPSVKKLFLKA